VDKRNDGDIGLPCVIEPDGRDEREGNCVEYVFDK